MTNLQEQLTQRHMLFNGQVIQLYLDQVLLPNGKVARREVVGHPGATAIVPILPNGDILLVRQYRHPIQKELLELPAGKLDAGESPSQCALRELEEETGYTSGNMQLLSSICTTPGFSNEIIHIYKATQLKKIGQHLDEDEFLNLESYSPDQLKTFMRQGIIIDSKTLAGLCLAGLS